MKKLPFVGTEPGWFGKSQSMVGWCSFSGVYVIYVSMYNSEERHPSEPHQQSIQVNLQKNMFFLPSNLLLLTVTGLADLTFEKI